MVELSDPDEVTASFWGEWARACPCRPVRLPAQAQRQDVDVEEVA